jgi:hypothetical protein
MHVHLLEADFEKFRIWRPKEVLYRYDNIPPINKLYLIQTPSRRFLAPSPTAHIHLLNQLAFSHTHPLQIHQNSSAIIHSSTITHSVHNHTFLSYWRNLLFRCGYPTSISRFVVGGCPEGKCGSIPTFLPLRWLFIYEVFVHFGLSGVCAPAQRSGH